MLLSSLLTITRIFTRAGVKMWVFSRKLSGISRLIFSDNGSVLPTLISNDGF